MPVMEHSEDPGWVPPLMDTVRLLTIACERTIEGGAQLERTEEKVIASVTEVPFTVTYPDCGLEAKVLTVPTTKE